MRCQIIIMFITHLLFKEKIYFQINKSRPYDTQVHFNLMVLTVKRQWLIANSYRLH